jgi:phosphatidylglycerophosphate synthase
MFDARLRPLIDPPLNRLGLYLAARGISANQVTVLGFGLGMLALPLLAFQAYYAALACILLNRLCDGLDGAVARFTALTDLGGFLDIVLDFIFYAAVIFGFVLAQPHHASQGAFLIFSFIGTGTSFLAYSTFAAKRGLQTSRRGEKSLYYLGGLTEGFETLLCLVLMCLFPAAFAPLAVVFGSLCWLTTGTRIYTAIKTL